MAKNIIQWRRISKKIFSELSCDGKYFPLIRIVNKFKNQKSKIKIKVFTIIVHPALRGTIILIFAFCILHFLECYWPGAKTNGNNC